MWTVESVKHDLPRVKVNIFGQDTIGYLCGRKNRFATVYVSGGLTAEFAWEAVVRALNADRPLNF
jgi:hypothetical protein